MNYKVKTVATGLPLEVSDVKSHLRIEHASQDTLLGNILNAAIRKVEEDVLGPCITTVFTAFLDQFPIHGDRTIYIHKSPVSAIATVKYYDLDNTIQTLASEWYDKDINSSPARIKEAYGYYWPSTYPKMNAVEIEFTAGFVKAEIDKRISQAILMLCEHLYDNPSPVITGTQVNQVPMTYENLVNAVRFDRYRF